MESGVADKRKGSELQLHMVGSWTSYMTKEGRIVFVDQDSQVTQWSHPLLDTITLPAGWERKVDDDGRVHYQKKGDPDLRAEDESEAGTMSWVNPLSPARVVAAQADLLGLQRRVLQLANRTNLDRTNLSDPRKVSPVFPASLLPPPLLLPSSLSSVNLLPPH